MKIYRDQTFQKFKPVILENGLRSPICDVDAKTLRRIQKGTMQHSWKGVMCNKNPFDMALYGMLLYEIKPKTIIEIGYKFGGSALWFADQANIMGLEPELLCIDIEQREKFADPRIKFMHGDGRDLSKSLPIDLLSKLDHPWLVIEDADHSFDTTLSVLKFFNRYMKTGDYIAVEDGICDTFGNQDIYDGGPNKAIYNFLEDESSMFEVDAYYCDFFGNNVTWCTNGFLRRS